MKFKEFRVTNYRNILDSGPIDVSDVTAFVGQNEAGKSNLFEALYRISPFETQADYSIDEDWPVDRWGEKGSARWRYDRVHSRVSDRRFRRNLGIV